GNFPEDTSRKRASHGTPCSFLNHSDRAFVLRCDYTRSPDTLVCPTDSEPNLFPAGQTKRRQCHRWSEREPAGASTQPSMPGVSWPAQATAIHGRLAVSQCAAHGI